jgi:hypothetical protein
LIVWLNGAFGVGKSSATAALVQLAGAAVFDPEEIGRLVTGVRAAPSGDFQDLPVWRRLVAAVAGALADHACGPLLVPMTVLTEAHAREIFDRVREGGHQLTHLVLHCTRTELAARIDRAAATDAPAVAASRRDWRYARLPDYFEALPWLRTLGHTQVIDTTRLSTGEVAGRVLRSTRITDREHR